ncbi:MAG: hypothetical protein OXG36_10765 [Caldilineaceae bacterium]|nr:hypothetical protein [Caldilineaceae bacterium]
MFRQYPRKVLLLVLMLGSVAAGACAASPTEDGASAAPETASRDTLVFADYNWPSAQIQNRIVQYLVEEGYGYPTDVVFGETLPLYQGFRTDDIHVSMEIWLPNQVEIWSQVENDGVMVAVGESLSGSWQSTFVIPAYLQAEYPELDSIEDLREEKYKALFATAETDGKARLVNCVIGWACEAVGARQIESYGLSEHVHVVNPGGSAALYADLFGAYEQGRPWLGYMSKTDDPAQVLDLVRLEEPPYSDECWATTKACAYVDTTMLIAVRPWLLERAPDVVDLLRAYSIDLDTYQAIFAWMFTNETSENNAALWWLANHPGIWGEWVTEAAAASVLHALEAGEIPDGWPVQ